jgi:hypothetical protein
MRMLRDLKLVLFGWQNIERKCYVNRIAVMKNYEEFKGYQFRVDFDAASGSFGYKTVPLPSRVQVEEPILFRPKNRPLQTAQKIKRTA